MHLPRLKSSSLLAVLLLSLSTTPTAQGEESLQDTNPVIPPSVSVTNITEGGHYNRDIIPRILIRSRNLKTSRVTLDGSPYLSDTPVGSEGMHTLVVYAEDTDNSTASLRTIFFIDKSPPATELAVSGSLTDDKGTIVVTGRSEIVVSSLDPGPSPSGIKTIECRLDGGDRQPYLEPIALSGLDDGTHVLYCSTTDKAGNTEEEKKLSFLIANYPPTTVVSLSPPHRPLEKGELMASPDTVFSLFASGSPSGIAMTEYQIDGGPWQTYAPFKISEQGEHTLRFKSTDRLGNSEPAKEARVKIDKTAPVTDIHIGKPSFSGTNNRTFVSAATPFKLTATSPVIGIAKTEYRIDNKKWDETLPFTIGEEGNHQIAFRSRDAIGNVENLHSVQVTVDLSPPRTTLSMNGQKVPPDEVIFRRGAATVTLAATDTLAGVKTILYQLDGKEWKEYASPLSLSDEKNHTLGFRSIDNVGNEEPPQTVTVKNDSIPPVSAISVGSPHMIKGSTHVTGQTLFTVTATDPASGVGTVEYRLDSGPWQTYAPFSVSTSGKHLIEFRSRDKVGNEESVRSLPIVVESSSPVTNVSAGGKPVAPDGTLFMTGKEGIKLTGSSPVWAIEHIQYRIDEGEWNIYTQPILLEEEGEYLLEFYSTDAGGNEEESRSVTVVVDRTPPESNIMIGQPKYERDGVVHIESGTVLTPVATDDLSGIGRIEHQLQGQAVESDSIPFSIATMGKYELAYWSIDKAGNKEAVKKIKLEVSPAPTRFSEKDLLLANELTPEQPDIPDAGPVIHAEEAPATPQPAVLAELPPDIIEPPPPPQQPANKSFFYWTMGILQGLLIIGVMAL